MCIALLFQKLCDKVLNMDKKLKENFMIGVGNSTAEPDIKCFMKTMDEFYKVSTLFAASLIVGTIYDEEYQNI